MNLRGLYLILDEGWAVQGSLEDVLCQAGEVGVQIVQYRCKATSMNQAYQVGAKLRTLAGEWGMVFIVNDRCDLAVALDADGVHLGQDDLPLRLAKELLGSRKIIGVSTHNTEQVRLAAAEGADYLGFGPIFPTSTKQKVDPIVGVEGVRRVRGLTTLPIFAIGGIRPEHVADLKAAGADGVAVASAVLNAKNKKEMFTRLMAPYQGGASLA